MACAASRVHRSTVLHFLLDLLFDVAAKHWVGVLLLGSWKGIEIDPPSGCPRQYFSLQPRDPECQIPNALAERCEKQHWETDEGDTMR